MSGFHLYTGNRLEILADKFAQLLYSDPLPPLEKETILVQSRGMARWLALQTAARLNIWANCECPFPNTFIQNIYKLFIPHIAEFTPYDKELMTWQIMDLLPGLLQNPHFKKVAVYLESDDDLKLYQLATETADLFDQYTIFRPEMILAWEDSKLTLPGEHLWQSILWKELVDRCRQSFDFPGFHRARLLNIFEESMRVPNVAVELLPRRISIFGISTLPPYHLRVLASLARYIDLHLYIMNPSQEYWLDIIADRDIAKISRKATASRSMLHLHRGNSLLSSMGHLGRDFLAMLQELHCNDFEFYQDPGTNSLLACIQQDILYLRENPDFLMHPAEEKKKISDRDISLTFHSCHTPMREVEILHDQLLHIFNQPLGKNPIEPREILVMAPDIDEYAPFIQAVFAAETTAKTKIPYSIADRSIRKTSKYIDTFLKLMTMGTSRFSSIEILEILGTDAVKNRFSLTDANLSTLEIWLRETRICWGIDHAHKENLGLPAYAENTWRTGLDRLLLGYAMPGQGKILFKNILPYDAMEGSDTELLGALLDFTDILFSLAESLRQPHNLAEWSDILLQAKEKLMLADEESEVDDRLLHQILHSFRKLQSITTFDRPISVDVMRSFLLSSLEQRHATGYGDTGFLSGGVTFCSMLPMRAIPFKIIWLLGMNDGLYPRSGRKNSFDLMALEPRRGDRSRRYDDRYLFLEAILSARQRLSISFIGQSVQDGSIRPPSVLVSELMNYVDQAYAVTDMNDIPLDLIGHLTSSHRLHPFHPDYFKQRDTPLSATRFSYSADNYTAAVALSSQHLKAPAIFASALPPPDEEFKQVELEELIKFFSHPARYLLLKRIGIAPIEDSKPLNTTEPFALSGLDRYRLENDILGQLLAGGDLKKLYLLNKAEGKLPHGRIGEMCFAEAVSAVQQFKKTLDSVLSGQELQQQEVFLSLNDFSISGSLDNLWADGMVQYRFASINAKDIIRCWIGHLVRNCIKKPNSSEAGMVSYLAGKDKILTYIAVKESYSLLEQLLALYWQGLSEPLYFFPESSLIFAREIVKGKSKKEALLSAGRKWEGSTFYKAGEKKDPYNSLCFKNMDLQNPLFIDQAIKVFQPALLHQRKYRI